jgi:hypothetical protein
LREGQAASQLKHPQFAAVHDIGRWFGGTYIIADYVDGQSLAQFLKSNSLEYHKLAEICADLAEALHHAHERGIVHRDLKPANIILNPDGRAHVIDFGLAKLSTDDRDITINGELLGTPAYMSPELASGQGASAGAATDIYSLGVILYEMVSGACPFQGDRSYVLYQILNTEPPAPRRGKRRIPRDLETICLKSLQKNSSRRYTSIQEMAVDLRRFARGESILARRTGSVERSVRWMRRHPSATAAVFIVLAVAAGASSKLYSARNEVYKAQGWREVCVDCASAGRVAVVPIDPSTGEPDGSSSEIQRGRLPFHIYLRPGEYFIEGVELCSDGTLNVAENDLNIPTHGGVASYWRTWNHQHGYDEEALHSSVEFKSAQTLEGMVPVTIAEEIRRENPCLPKLFYIDAMETIHSASRDPLEPTSPVGTRGGITFDEAVRQVSGNFKRLPTAAEYDAIIKSLKEPENRVAANMIVTELEDESTKHAEWTSTKYRYSHVAKQSQLIHLENMRVLQGYGDFKTIPDCKLMVDGRLIALPETRSPLIGYRGVRSGTPRFDIP